MTGNLGRKKEDLSTPSLGGPRAQLQVGLGWWPIGVEFIPADDEKGPGLRLKHKLRGKGVKQPEGAGTTEGAREW